MVMFSVIAVHYEGSTSKECLQRFIDSLKEQSYKDFELIILHDGPMSNDWGVNFYDIEVVKFISVERKNKWGHDLRTVGLKLSSGEYILHTNSDNVYYPHAFNSLNTVIKASNQQVFVTECKMMGLEYCMGRIFYSSPRDYSKYRVLKGNPLVFGNVDLMQVCIHRDLWFKVGLWYDLSEQSDGRIYECLGKEYGYEYVPFIIGEHY